MTDLVLQRMRMPTFASRAAGGSSWTRWRRRRSGSTTAHPSQPPPRSSSPGSRPCAAGSRPCEKRLTRYLTRPVSCARRKAQKALPRTLGVFERAKTGVSSTTDTGRLRALEDRRLQHHGHWPSSSARPSRPWQRPMAPGQDRIRTR